MQTTEQVLKQQQEDADRYRSEQGTVLPEAFDADSEEGSRTLLPAGKYKANITAATVGSTKSGRGVAVNLTWSITEGEYEKRLVFQNILIEHDNEDARRIGRHKFKDVCVSCGVTGQVTDLDVLLYKECLVTISIRVDKNGQYADQNDIKNVLPVPHDMPVVNTAPLLKQASSTPKAFNATAEAMDDEIPFD